MGYLDVRLGALWVRLASDDAPVMAYWQAVFVGWPQVLVPEAAELSGGSAPDICLEIRLQAVLPPKPEAEPDYIEADEQGPVGLGGVAVYQQAEGVVIYYADRAWVTVPLVAGPLAEGPSATKARWEATGWVTPATLTYGVLEALTFTCLAPMLRRLGYYFLHAFGAQRDGKTVLLLGESGSGKSTTGLALLLAGWQLVTNDVVLLAARTDGVWAWPTPCSLSITPATMALLPALQAVPTQTEANPYNGKFNCPVSRMPWLQWGEAGKVDHLVWPQVVAVAGDEAVRPYPRPLALAHLLTESMDRWDQGQQAAHLAVLTQLARHTRSWQLLVDRDVAVISERLANLDG